MTETAQERARRLWNSTSERFTLTPVREWEVGGKVRSGVGEHTITRIVRGEDAGGGERFIFDRIYFSDGYTSLYRPSYQMDYWKGYEQ